VVTYKRLCCLKHSAIDFEREWKAAGGNIPPALITMCRNKENDCEQLNCLYASGDCDPFFDVHKPVHSDFLVHWTGLDIDNQYDPNWEQSNDPKLNATIVEPYIKRLKNILEYGLWMTSSDNDQPLIYKKKINRKPFSRTCFTELKLSETRVHAKRFGRLGIGVKRPFVMGRKGAPVIYFREEFGNWFFASFEKDKVGETSIPDNAWWAYYLKSMNEGETNLGYMQYKNFDESEWRVVFSEEIRKRFGDISGIDKCPERDEFYRYLIDCRVAESKKPQYLLKLDKWFSIIIYPSLAVKVAAESDDDIRKRIEEIKPKLPTNANPSSSAAFEKYSKPFEINLSALRNF
jgi:hypothetical protein